MNFINIKKLLIKAVYASLFLSFFISSFSFAADFIVPNSSGEPIVIDVSNLNLTAGTDVSIGEFTDQPRSYRDSNTKSIAIFPPAASDSERTIQIRAGSTIISKTISFRSSPGGNLKDSLLPDLREARAGNTVTKISDGRIVLIGGSKGFSDEPLSTLEVFDPETGRSEFLKIPDNSKKTKLQIPRSQHSATYLGVSNSSLGMISPPVEQILLTGGFSNGGLLEGNIEIVEISIGTNQAVSTLLTGKKAKLKKARIYHSASLLPDGRVLIIGGQGRINKTNLGALNSIEIFDPLSKSVQSSLISLSTPRILHTATTLQNGNILIAGGFTNEKTSEFGPGPATDTAELIDTKAFTIKQVSPLKRAVGGHTATLLTNGLVLIIGGNADLFAGAIKNVNRGLSLGAVQYYDNKNEIFNFATNRSSGGNLELQIPRFLHETVLLPNGNLAVIGGLNIKSGVNAESFINTPVARIEVLAPDLIASGDNALKIDQKSPLETFTGRILPTAILVTPKNKTQGFLSASDAGKFVNCAVYVAGGFTNGFGKLPTKASNLLQIESNVGIEGAGIDVTPSAVIQGSYLGELLVQIGKFSTVPSLKVEPQTVNLSTSNNFLATVMVFSTNDQNLLLKPVSTDSIIVSPSLFQAGDNVTITRKDPSVQGQFEVNFLPAGDPNSFIPAKVTVNVSNSSMPFLVTVPPYGISLSTQEEFNIQPVQIKIFSEDGMTELTSVLPNTFITATIADPGIANIIGTGISSVTGTIQTQFQIKAVKPGKTTLTFSINSPDILPISIPVQISATPTFPSNAGSIDDAILNSLATNGVGFSGTKNLNSTSFLLQDVILSANAIFPIYVPINLQSSIDGTTSPGLFTIRPIFGVDLLTAIPRTFVNKGEKSFKTPFTTEPLAIGGLSGSSDLTKEPLAVLALDDGVKVVNFTRDNQNLKELPDMLNSVSDVKDLKLFEFGSDETKKTKIAAIKGAMILLLNAKFGDVESSAALSGEGFELELTEINNQTAAVVSLGAGGVDFVFPITDANPRVENSRVAGNVKHITVVKKLGDKTGPFVVAYDDDAKVISIRNLTNLNDPVLTINTSGERFTKIAYAGKFLVNSKITDVLICAGERSVTLFDLNNLTAIPFSEDLKIKTKIEDLLVLDGTAYLALGEGGILALSVGSLIANNKQAVITTFTKNKLILIKPSGKEAFITKLLNAKKLANAKPFLLSSGINNNLTVIRVSP
ncbi:MAG: hypothetical protein A3I68_01745 [Candidatus Melainabacteria bacterium RIFCSPLOWO2_02_FULL_35_15]|nr:MAG: hypothetical protein A3F80_09620 [Candidatus Melainabacteria bacterium RIFCSPLOWO2_12_FULL_35_11]OGI14279.1 MAG: hypothetical protein A3I68_01745 [Candidatus Melainabacteria bacterium RIFCSPLOWO2_02_FULL_35_15]